MCGRCPGNGFHLNRYVMQQPLHLRPAPSLCTGCIEGHAAARTFPAAVAVLFHHGPSAHPWQLCWRRDVC